MSITNLFTDSAHKKAKRAGRGISAGLGKTAGRGTKGQKARAGSGRKISEWFEGGQTPVFRKIAKKRGTHGFLGSKKRPVTITTDIINRFYKDAEVVSPATLIEKKIIRPSQAKQGIKIVKRNDLKSKVIFEGVKTSKSLG